MRLVWFSGVAALCLLAGIAWYLRSLEPSVLALQFAFSPQAFAQVVHLWSPDQLGRFRTHLAADAALLVSYGLFGHRLATRSAVFGTWPTGRRRLAAWALPAAAAFDAGENLLQLWLTEAPRLGMAWPYGLAAACASAKWLLLLGFALAVSVALARAGRAGDGPEMPGPSGGPRRV